MLALTASAPRANASSALNAQVEPCQGHDQPDNETNSEAHWKDRSGIRQGVGFYFCFEPMTKTMFVFVLLVHRIP